MWTGARLAPPNVPRASAVRCSSTRLPYKHGFHAGNAADVLKHTVLILLLQHMQLKEKPYIFCDTHAGAGMYDLLAEESAHLQEHDRGINLLRRSVTNNEQPDAVNVLLSICDDYDGYPGSPLIANALSRPGDSMFVCERAEDQHARLVESLARRGGLKNDPRITALCADGYKALTDRRSCPQAGKTRALVLVDPPYQYGSDTEQIVRLVQHLSTHWRSARVAIWYPVTRDTAKVERLHSAVRDASPFECFAVELLYDASGEDDDATTAKRGSMLGSGMLLVQPPFGIETILEEELLPALGDALGQRARIHRLDA